MLAVSEIGLKSFFGSFTIFVLGNGVILAIFQTVGTRCSRYEAFKINVIGRARTYEYSLNTQLGNLSGPLALFVGSLIEHFALLFRKLLGKLMFLSMANVCNEICNLYSSRGPRNALLISFACSIRVRLENVSTLVKLIGSCLLLKLEIRLTSFHQCFGLYSFILSRFSL